MGTSAPATSAQSSPAAIQKNLAQLAANVLLGAKPGSVTAIPNALTGQTLDTTVLTDPAKIEAFRLTLAGQINSQSGASFVFSDLGERISDIIIGTSAQGAGTLEVHLIDPYWVMLNTTDKQGNQFFQTDANGYLWPPIDVNFPAGSGVFWRLCQVHVTLSAQPTEGNLVLTFEDRIVSQLRNVSALDGGITQGQPGQTLAGFFKQLVDSANQVMGASIQLLELVSPADPNYQAPTVPTTPRNVPGPGVAPPGFGHLQPFPAFASLPGGNAAKPIVAPQISGPASIANIEQNIASAISGLPPGFPTDFSVGGSAPVG